MTYHFLFFFFFPVLSWTHHWSYRNSVIVSSIIVSWVILADHTVLVAAFVFQVGSCQCATWLCVCFPQCVCIVVSCRTSILSEVSTRSSSKLPSGKNILVFGKCVKISPLQCLQFICDGQPWGKWRARKLQNHAELTKAVHFTLKPFCILKQLCFFPHAFKEDIIDMKVYLGVVVFMWVGPSENGRNTAVEQRNVFEKLGSLWQAWVTALEIERLKINMNATNDNE